ncbi:MAG: 3'-5' exonuclease, partial [Cyanobacteria bacterium P01_H01_bin.121]
WDRSWQRVSTISPLRYLNRALKQVLPQQSFSQPQPLDQLFTHLQADAPNSKTLQDLKALTRWFAAQPDQLAADLALQKLDLSINYRSYLRHRSGSVQTGQGKVASVDAILTYAEQKGTLAAFLDHLDALQAQAEQQTQTPEQCIRLTTIHQSKGLEWPVVIVPDCNQGILPFGEDLTPAGLEEERRLMYVAITRSRQHLYLHALKGQALSQFLREAKHAETLQHVQAIQDLLAREPETWQARDALQVLQLTQKLGLQRYFEQWWSAEQTQKVAIATTLQQFWRAVQHHDALERLQLSDGMMSVWPQIQPLASSQLETPTEPDFPGLVELLAATIQPSETPSVFGSLACGDRVEHATFGAGTVTRIINRPEKQEEVISVQFDRGRKRRILITQAMCALELLQV